MSIENTVARHEHEVPPIAVTRVLHHELHPGAIPEATEYYSQETEEQSLMAFAAFQTTVEEYTASLLVHWPGEQEIEQMDENLRASFERWHTLLETALEYCGNVDLCLHGYNRTLVHWLSAPGARSSQTPACGELASLLRHKRSKARSSRKYG